MKRLAACLRRVRVKARDKRTNERERRAGRDAAELSRHAAMGIFLVCLFAVLAALLLTTKTASVEKPGPEVIYIDAPNAAEKITEAAPKGTSQVSAQQDLPQNEFASHVTFELEGDPAQTVESGFEGNENALIEAALIGYARDHEDVMPECRVTWYTANTSECGKSDGITASGFKAIEGATIGVDPDVIPLLSDVCVEWPDGTREWYVATDTGVTGAEVDIYCADRERAIANGVKTATVYWIPSGAIT